MMLTNKLQSFFADIFLVALLFFVCTSSTKSPPSRRLEILFPDSSSDIIVFPTEDSISSGSNGDLERQNRHHQQFPRRNPNFYRTNAGNDNEKHKNESISSIPLDLIRDINEFDDVNQVLKNFVIEDGPPSIEDRFGTGERNAVISPKSAGCIPELQTIKLASSVDVSVLYIPQCTRIERCGGCCSHNLLTCQPTDIQTVSFSVMKTQYVGGKKLKFLGKEVIQVDKHLKCKCDCKIKAEDCNPYQQYKKSECRCACINIDEEKKCYRKNQTKLWDPELCQCICREVTKCSTGFEFDPIECKCAPKPTRNRYSGVIHFTNDDDEN